MSQEILPFLFKNFGTFSRISVWFSPCRIAIQLRVSSLNREETFRYFITEAAHRKRPFPPIDETSFGRA